MTPQERQLLEDFLEKLSQVRGTTKDPEADTLIARAVAEQPDAPYLMAQRALLLEQALNNAKAQIVQLQSQVNPNNSARSFLGTLTHWGQTSSPPPAPQPQAMPPGSSRWGGGSFLGNLASTAAGVAGGAFLFQGIESLFGHHGGFLGQGGQEIVENVNVDNYYGSDPGSGLAADSGDSGSAMDTGFDDSSIDGDSSSWI